MPRHDKVFTDLVSRLALTVGYNSESDQRLRTYVRLDGLDPRIDASCGL